MHNERFDIQGRWLGLLPYDFRRPTWSKVKSRLYRPGDSLWVPKVFGAGWTLNVAHPQAKWVGLATLILVSLGLWVG
jgi:hypothetical protein